MLWASSLCSWCVTQNFLSNSRNVFARRPLRSRVARQLGVNGRMHVSIIEYKGIRPNNKRIQCDKWPLATPIGIMKVTKLWIVCQHAIYLSLSLPLHKSLFVCVLLPEFQRIRALFYLLLLFSFFFLPDDTWCDEEGENFPNKSSIFCVNLIQFDMELPEKSLRWRNSRR